MNVLYVGLRLGEIHSCRYLFVKHLGLVISTHFHETYDTVKNEDVEIFNNVVFHYILYFSDTKFSLDKRYFDKTHTGIIINILNDMIS